MIFMDFYIFFFLKTTLHKGAIAFFNSSPHQETLCVNPIRSLG